MSDYETLRRIINHPQFPAVIEWRNGMYGFYCGRIPTELADTQFTNVGDAVYALIRSKAAKQGIINAF